MVFNIRPGHKIRARAGASRDSAAMARVRRAGRAGRAGAAAGAGRPVAKFTAIAVAIAIVAIIVIVEEDILRTISISTGQ